MFNQWPTHIGDIEFCPVQLPGRENRIREPHFGTYEKLATQLAHDLSPYFDKPFGFFGHCGGALPAFATVLELASRKMPPPRCLFVSSQVAPHLGPYGRFLHLNNTELATELASFIRSSGGEPNQDVIGMSLRILRADITANQVTA